MCDSALRKAARGMGTLLMLMQSHRSSRCGEVNRPVSSRDAVSADEM